MAKNLKKSAQTKIHEDPKKKSFFEKLFGVSMASVDWSKEILAGLSGLIGTAFILFTFQKVLGGFYGLTGGAENVLMVGTLIAMILSNLAQSIWAKLPYIITPSIGTLVILFPLLGIGDFNVLMAIILLEGAIFLTISFLPFVKRIIPSIPASVKHSIVISMGLMLVFMGLSMSGVFGDQVIAGGNLKAEQIGRISFAMGTPSFSLRWLLDARTVVMSLGLILIAYFSFSKNRWSVPLTIIMTAAIGLLFVSFHQQGSDLTRVTPIAFVDYMQNGQWILPFGNWASGTLLKPGIIGFVSKAGSDLMIMLSAFVIFLAKDTIGTSVTLVGLGRQSGDMGENDESHHNSHKALQVIGFNRIVSGLVGGVPADISPESSLAIEAEGKTSITPLVYAGGLAILLLGFNFFAMVPAIAAAPVFVLIGAGMLRGIGKIHWKDSLESIPAVCMMTVAALTFNIFFAVTIGIAIGLILRIAVWKFDDTNGGYWMIGLLSLASVILYSTTFMR